MISVEALELLLKVDSAVEHHDIGLMGEARYLDAKENLQDYIASLESQLAARDALIERMVEAVQRVDTELNDNWICEGDEPLIFMLMKVQDIVAEYRASKDGGSK